MDPQPTTNDRPRILAVDDDPITTLIIEDSLAHRFQVEIANSGEQALQLFEQLSPDLILLDVMMQGMDGFEVCTALRSHSKGQTLPVVMLTSQDDLGSIARAFEVGATDFIAKPINTALIAHRVAYLLRAHATLKALARQERQLAAAQRIARLGHWEFNPAQDRFQFAEAACELLNLPHQPQGLSLHQVLAQVHPRERAEIEQHLLSLDLEQRPSVQFEHRLCAGPRVLRQNVEYSSELGGWLGTVQDVTAMHRSAQRIIKLAYYDRATGLPNRDFFLEYLQRRLDQDDTAELCVLVVEIDALKRVGMGWGQAVTEPLARNLSRRLTADLDITAPEAPLPSPQAWNPDQPLLLARISDAAFALFATADSQAALRLSQRLLTVLSQPLRVTGIELPMKAKVGLSNALDCDQDANTVLHHALAATATACQSADKVQTYHRDLDIGERSRLTLEARLRRAIDQHELELWYQPKVDGRSGRLIGAEGLVRWRDPKEGLIPPGHFIPLAEETGLIVPLTNQVLDLVCADLSLMHAPGLSPVKVSVNISAAQLDDERLPEEIAQRLSSAGLSPLDLELEITERALMARLDSVLGTLSALHRLGISLSLDDFGTGYSSLGYLGRFPIDELKIDQSFVRDLGTGAADEMVVRAIVALARGLGLWVIAEGIETQEQATWLCANGCEWHQGYLYSRPLERDAFLQLLDRRAPPPWNALPCLSARSDRARR
ncbi:EAL domain-containing protein [Lamprobacter modestohalophilus]|uniref:EAL domain-containing protein n=1 Tax=Lamprobacter modestohalophilus TaxID=1064514 RepID=UPI001902D109